MKKNGIIIGGGAAGLMAAIAAAEAGAGVTIIEHMPRVGKKILSTGNGKCNMTNRKLTAECYRSSQADFPMKVIGQFPVPETIGFFRTLGVVTKDRDGYVYPASGQAQTVLDALREKAESLGVTMVCGCEPVKICPQGKNDRPHFLVKTDQGDYAGDFLILAAGSMAAKSTGSDGSGYGLAESLGHKVKKPLPALVQLRCRGDFFKSVAGVRAEAKVELFAGHEFLASDRGEVQLTDYGISGIPVFQVSRFAAEALDVSRPVAAVLDFSPERTEEELFFLLKEQREYLKGRRAEGFLNGLFNKKLAALFLKNAGILKDTAVEELSDKKLWKLVAAIKEWTVEVSATNSYDQAQVCMGGVMTKDVDSQTMESRLVPGLYFAGEILDVDGICGGYNLQWAWSSGHVAGENAAMGEDRRQKKSSATEENGRRKHSPARRRTS